jgi:hypothetical protein
MNVTDLVDPAGAGSTDRWVRSFNMDQLVSRKNRDLQHFDEDDWTILGWQDRRVLNDAGTHGKDTNRKDISNTDTIVGLVYFSLLIIFMLVYLT